MVGMMDLEQRAKIAAAQREQVLKLMDDTNKLETEIREWRCILDQNGIGMEEPLVDVQGFPRSDIDVYQVRQARHKLICLNNDLKAVMKAIEEGLHLVHATASNSNLSTNSTALGATVEEQNSLEPFVRVKAVVPDSPAFISGLQSDDLVVEFGSVNCKNFKSLEDISRVVHHSINSTINLRVQRGHHKLILQLCPKQWSGRGLLGCTVLPIENIER